MSAGSRTIHYSLSVGVAPTGVEPARRDATGSLIRRVCQFRHGAKTDGVLIPSGTTFPRLTDARCPYRAIPSVPTPFGDGPYPSPHTIDDTTPGGWGRYTVQDTRDAIDDHLDEFPEDTLTKGAKLS